jgi:hypothetical protein
MYLTSDDDDHDYIPPSTRKLPILPLKLTNKSWDEFRKNPIGIP